MKKITTLLALLLFVVSQGAFAQRTITGKIISAEDGLGMPGVTILVKGTTVGTATDIDGNFSLNVPNDATIVISFMGFRTVELSVGNQTRFDVTLEPDVLTLGDVVVTALGISRSTRTLTYSVTEVGGESIAQAKEINLGNALAGRIAGVNVSSSATGQMGSTRVLIRGNTALTGSNQPLYVVDGVPTDMGGGTNIGSEGGRDTGDGLSRINPDDIESISVLKGGSAAALYGSRAASGVVLITTKSGRAQQGLGVEYSMSYSMENPLSVPQWQYEYGSGTGGNAPTNRGEAINAGRYSWGAKFGTVTQAAIPHPFEDIMKPYVPQKNNVNNYYSTGTTFQNTIALSGGNQTANFRFSASNMDAKGIVSNATMNRKILNLSVNANLAKRIIFESRVQYNIEMNKNPTSVGGVTDNPNAAIAMMATSIDVRDLKLDGYGGYNDGGPISNEFKWTEDNFIVNPWWTKSQLTRETLRQRLFGSFSIRYNIFDFLYARVRVGTDYSTSEGLTITPDGTMNTPLGSMSRSLNKSMEYNYEGMLVFDKTFGDISVNALAGGSQRHSPQGYSYSLSGAQFQVPGLHILSNTILSTPSIPTPSESKTNSLYGSGEVGYKNFLFLSFSGRQDWFSTLTNPMQKAEAPGNNTIFYPSVGLSYIISETWNSRPVWMSFAKARASWAQVGGGAPGAYGGRFTYSFGSYSHLGQKMMGLGNQIPNWALKPYTTTTMEAGVDLRLFNNRIGVDFTVYQRNTVDDRVSVNLPSTSGYGSTPMNIGKVENRGIELLLTGTPITSRTGLTWDVTFNTAYNKNNIVDIAEEMGVDRLNQAQARTMNGWVYHWIGEPYGMVTGYDYKRSETSGKIIYNPTTGYPLQSDLKPLGQGTPPLNISLTNSFRYKNFNMSFFIDSKWGGVIYSGTNAYGYYYGLHKNTAANGVRENGITVKGVTVDASGVEKDFEYKHTAERYFGDIYNRITAEFVQKSDFIKLRQIDFGYSVPRSFLTKINVPIQSLNASFVARNLFLIYSAVDNVDPESSNNTDSGYGLEGFGVFPTRSFGFSLSVRF